jgi:hypothetical protein
MTTLLPGRCGGGMVKGLARFANRLRHGRMAKHVDAGTSQEGGYSPMTAGFYPCTGDPSTRAVTCGQTIRDGCAARYGAAADR